METVFSVIDERYRSRKPLIVTTNLSLKVIQDTKADMAHARIYDRILEMCTPILFTGPSIRRKHNKERMKTARELLG